MSLQKLKHASSMGQTDRYSKNSVLNSIIRSKLEGEMTNIKQNCANIIKKDSVQLNSSTRIRFRKAKSHTLTVNAINEGLSYNPLPKDTRLVDQFIAARQVDSFLVPQQQLIALNVARQDFRDLTVKFSKSDVLKYGQLADKSEFINRVHKATVRELGQQAWIPDNPAAKYNIEQLAEQFSQQYPQRNQVSESRLFNRLVGASLDLTAKLSQAPLSSLTEPDAAQLRPTDYTPQRFHKNDYKILQQWFQAQIGQLKEHSSLSIQQKLNLIYSVYIAAFKQLSRLTYIESEEKGLILDKVFYSMLRLFWGILSEQQSLGRAYQNQIVQEQRELRAAMEKTIDELRKKSSENLKEMGRVEEKILRISQALITYEKVNHELVQQLEKVTSQKNQSERELNNIGNIYYKALQTLYDKALVEQEVTQQPGAKKPFQYKTFFMLDNQSKPLVLGRFKLEGALQGPRHRFLSKLPPQDISQQASKYRERYGAKIGELENQMVKLWSKIENDYQVKGIINNLVLTKKVQDVGVGPGASQTNEAAVQFPQQHQQYLQQILDELRKSMTEQFEHERLQLQARIAHSQQLLDKWRSNYEELQDRNRSLHEQLHRANQNSKKSKQSAGELTKQLDKLILTCEQNSQQINQLQNQLQNARFDQAEAYRQKETIERQNKSLEAETIKQRQNNRMLVRANLQLKEQVEKLDIRYGGLLRSVKSVAPWLQKYLMQAEKQPQDMDVGLLRTIGSKIELSLGEFVTKDSSLFMTRVA